MYMHMYRVCVCAVCICILISFEPLLMSFSGGFFHQRDILVPFFPSFLM